jgi:capsid portal protein
VVWFKKYGIQEDYNYLTGDPLKPGEPLENRATELLIFRKPSRRSTWYGIPTYVSAIGWIMLGLTARDYNITFFTNAREPRHVFVITGLDEEVDNMIEELANTLSQQHKDPHRNLIIPLTGDSDVKIQRLSLNQNDLHFSRLLDKVDEEILVAHRIPPDRIGVVHRGFLGGNVAGLLNRIYKDSIVDKGQALLLDRLNKFVQNEWARLHPNDRLQWQLDLEDLDLTDESMDIDNTVKLLKFNVISINEARQRLGLLAKEEFGEMTLAQYLESIGASAEMAKAEEEEQKRAAFFEEEIARRLQSIDETIESILFGDMMDNGDNA